MTRPPNFGYAPPQMLRINFTFQEQMFCYRRIHAVLLSYHSIELVGKKNSYDSTMVGMNASGCFCVVAIFLLNNTRTYLARLLHSLIEINTVISNCTQNNKTN